MQNPQRARVKMISYIVVAVIVGYMFGARSPHPFFMVNNDTPDAVVCTMEAKQCPDGSYVGRQGPNCEFAICPAQPEPIQTGWKTFYNQAQGFSVQYPETLPTTYIAAQELPPTISIQSGKINCLSLPLHTVSDREYCVESTSEGAAGSVYIHSVYRTYLPEADKTVSLEFTLRAVQCANYDEPQASACEQERETFDMDIVVDTMVRSMVFTSQ